MDVAIVGVGLHPFGRFGELTGIDMGAIAVRAALADAGIEWRDVQFAFAYYTGEIGSISIDPSLRLLGPCLLTTGIYSLFINP